MATAIPSLFCVVGLGKFDAYHFMFQASNRGGREIEINLLRQWRIDTLGGHVPNSYPDPAGRSDLSHAGAREHPFSRPERTACLETDGIAALRVARSFFLVDEALWAGEARRSRPVVYTSGLR